MLFIFIQKRNFYFWGSCVNCCNDRVCSFTANLLNDLTQFLQNDVHFPSSHSWVRIYSSAAILKKADKLRPCVFAIQVSRSFSFFERDIKAVALSLSKSNLFSCTFHSPFFLGNLFHSTEKIIRKILLYKLYLILRAKSNTVIHLNHIFI